MRIDVQYFADFIKYCFDCTLNNMFNPAKHAKRAVL